MAEFKIGIWGTSRTGKTTYLAMLYQEFMADHSQWEIHTDDHTRQFLERAYEQIYEQQVFPEKTVKTQTYEYHILNKNDGQQFTLEFLDTAGELYEDYYERQQRRKPSSVTQRDTENQKTDKTPQKIFDHLKQCDGILMFLDPAWSDRSYAQLIWQVLEDLREGRQKSKVKRQPPLLALCVTKSDIDNWEGRGDFKPNDCYRTHTRADCANYCPAYDLLGDVFMMKWLPSHPSERVRCFILSSIGRTSAGELNVSAVNAWQRAATPTPQFNLSQNLPQWQNLKDALSERPAMPTYHPRSINKPREIHPYALQEPIRWMLNFAATPSINGD